MKLHVLPPSPNAIKVLATAHHLDLPFELVMVDLFKGDQNSPAFAALNPNQKMPVLEDDDGFVLWESNAIMQYLAAQRPESGLWPAEPKAQADVARWQFWQTAHFGPTCGVYIFERVVKRIAAIGPANEAEVAKAEPDFHKYADVLDGQLRGKRWVTGDRLTIADFSLAAWMVYGGQAGFPLDRYREITRWYAGIVGLPAWKRTLPPE